MQVFFQQKQPGFIEQRWIWRDYQYITEMWLLYIYTTIITNNTVTLNNVQLTFINRFILQVVWLISTLRHFDQLF